MLDADDGLAVGSQSSARIILLPWPSILLFTQGKRL